VNNRLERVVDEVVAQFDKLLAFMWYEKYHGKFESGRLVCS
jgi:hypothetical protein